MLSLVASTPLENAMLGMVLRNGYLSTVKLWMDDIMKGTLGKLGGGLCYLNHSSVYYCSFSQIIFDSFEQAELTFCSIYLVKLHYYP